MPDDDRQLALALVTELEKALAAIRSGDVDELRALCRASWKSLSTSSTISRPTRDNPALERTSRAERSL